MTSPSFGGPWTREKLEILSKYLDAYTTALKEQAFQLIYVDAFAGAGSYQVGLNYTEDYGDFQELHNGSPRIALGILDKPFDRLLFIERDPDRCVALENLRASFPDRRIEIRNEDANDALPDFCGKLGNYDRAVVFLDPFATQVSWATVERLARTEKIDCWILFPLMAIERMLPTSKEPSEALARQLDRIFGGREHWADFYNESPQQRLSLVDEGPLQESRRGSEQISARYRKRL